MAKSPWANGQHLGLHFEIMFEALGALVEPKSHIWDEKGISKGDQEKGPKSGAQGRCKRCKRRGVGVPIRTNLKDQGQRTKIGDQVTRPGLTFSDADCWCDEYYSWDEIQCYHCSLLRDLAQDMRNLCF